MPIEPEDDLRPEYDLTKLRLRRVGPARAQQDPSLVRLDPDVVEVFPSSKAVNEALRGLIQAMKSAELPLSDPVPNPSKS